MTTPTLVTLMDEIIRHIAEGRLQQAINNAEIVRNQLRIKKTDLIRDAIAFGYNHSKGNVTLEFITDTYLKANDLL